MNGLDNKLDDSASLTVAWWVKLDFAIFQIVQYKLSFIGVKLMHKHLSHFSGLSLGTVK